MPPSILKKGLLESEKYIFWKIKTKNLPPLNRGKNHRMSQKKVAHIASFLFVVHFSVIFLAKNLPPRHSKSLLFQVTSLLGFFCMDCLSLDKGQFLIDVECKGGAVSMRIKDDSIFDHLLPVFMVGIRFFLTLTVTVRGRSLGKVICS